MLRVKVNTKRENLHHRLQLLLLLLLRSETHHLADADKDGADVVAQCRVEVAHEAIGDEGVKAW